jgi:hypothetical protein
MTERKKIRNKIYKFCGWGMIAVELCFVLMIILPTPGWVTMIIEIILLHLFGASWLVKGEAIKWLNDE